MATTPSEADVAARLIERLLADPGFRARFRRDPAGACREAGLESLAQEMSLGGGKAFHTLDIRESRSSLAGVMMAAAMEGIVVGQFAENVLPALGQMPSAVADVVSRVDLPAINLPGGGNTEAVKASPVEPDVAPGAGQDVPSSDVPGVAGTPNVPGVAPANAGAGADVPSAPPPASPPPAATPPAADPPAAETKPPAEPKAPPAPASDPAGDAAKKIADENSPEAAQRAQEADAADALNQQTSGVPGSDQLPSADAATTPADGPPTQSETIPGDGATPPVNPGDLPAPDNSVAPGGPVKGGLPASGEATKSEGLAGAAKRFARRLSGGGGKGGASAAPADAGLPSAPAAAVDNSLPATPSAAENSLPATPDENSLPSAPTDGLPTAPVEPPTPEALALLANPNLTLDPGVVEGLQAGGTDPRLVGVLTQLGAGHKLTVSGTPADGVVDITKVDGELVNPDSAAARELAGALAALDPSVRPDEVGTPWPISSPGFITNSAHQDQLRLTFKPPAAPEAIAPAVAVPVTPAQPAVAAAVPVAPVQPAAPAYDPRKSDAFLPAVKATAASTREPDRTDSQAFLPAVEKPKTAAAQPAQLASQPAAGVAEVVAAAPGAYPGDNAPKEQLAGWMASEAQRRGLPPELPVMAALVESGLKNVNYGDADSLGFFQMRVSIWDSGPYKGFADKPELQIKWFLDEAEKVKDARVAAGKPIDDPQHYGEWIADTERPAAQYRYRYQTKLEEAKGLLANRTARPPAAAAVAVANPAPAPVGGPLGPAALAIAQGELGVREVGTNAGPKVDEYLSAAGVPSGNPWCASFITWSLEKAGHKMPGGGWAAVQTWVRNAEQGKNGLQIVSAEDARPGDIVAYDWGGQTDFGADGHIGFVASDVKDGKFTALEGNNADKVNSVSRTTGTGNVVFIRVNGDATAGGAPPVQAPAPSGAAAPPVDPKQFGGDEVGTGGAASAETLAALKNPNLVFDDVGKADLKAGRIDPRVIGVLTKLSQEHKITVSCMCSDHSKFTAGGSVSNHFYGRGVDIAAIDGEIVGPGSPLAREIASEVSTLDEDIRPNEIGSPFAIGGPGYFTDAAHQNHIHLGFKQEISPDWKPPADVAAQPVAAAPAQFAAAPGTPVATAAAAPAEPAFDPRQSDAFLPAVKATAAAADRTPERSDSQAFLPAVEQPKPAAAAAAQAPAVVPAQPAAVQPAAAAPAVDVSAAVAAAPTAYPGDSAPKEQIAAWMAAQAKERGLPPQLPIMAGLVESGLKNLNFGDADSVGFFQMRVGIWNQGAYAGYPDKPELQMKWFLDQAEAVKKQRLVAGKPIDDPNSFGEWIADVERPAEQYRGRYQTKLEEANQLLGAQPQPAAAAAVAQPVAAPINPAAAAAGAQLPAEIAAPLQQAIASGNGPGPKALAAITEAAKHMGTPYKWGGSTPQTGFDCSGLMQWAYAQSGVQIPRVTYTQIEAPNGVEIADRAQLKPGDLVFFAANGDVHHVGMFLGGDQFLHAPSTGDVVKVSSLSEPYYASQFAGGRRFDATAPVAAAAAQPAQLAAAAPIDPTEVAKAQAAVARDAAEVRRNDSQLFMAITRAEASKAAAEQERHASQLFLKAVDPSQVRRRSVAAAPPAAPPVAPPPVQPAPAQAAAIPVSAPAAPAQPAAPDPGVAGVSVDLTNAASEYPGDNASQAQLAKWLAKQAEAAGLPPELPVMAALVESGVKNLNYGDADSVGFFQMRVGIWDQGDYKGFATKPELQAKWFIDTALGVKRKAISRGDADFGKDPAKWGEWIADTERPAEQYRGRYQLRLEEARKLLA